MAIDDVDPVPCFEPPDERQHFVCREIEGMQHEAERLVFDQREEAKRAIPGPFDHQVVSLTGDGGFDIPRTLANCSDSITRLFQNRPIAIPGTRDSFLGVVKHVQVTRQTRDLQRDAKRHAACDVALAAAATLRG